jgi:hypothetical protein
MIAVRFLVLLALLAAPIAADAQQTGKAWRVGCYWPGSPSDPSIQRFYEGSCGNWTRRQLRAARGKHHGAVKYDP